MKLLDDRGGVELVRSLLQRNEDNDNPESPPTQGFSQPPLLQGSSSWYRCNKRRHQLKAFIVGNLLVTTSDLSYYSVIYVSTDTSCQLASLTATTFLVKIQNLLLRIIEKLRIASTLCTNSGTWEGQNERSSSLA